MQVEIRPQFFFHQCCAIRNDKLYKVDVDLGWSNYAWLTYIIKINSLASDFYLYIRYISSNSTQVFSKIILLIPPPFLDFRSLFYFSNIMSKLAPLHWLLILLVFLFVLSSEAVPTTSKDETSPLVNMNFSISLLFLSFVFPHYF